LHTIKNDTKINANFEEILNLQKERRSKTREDATPNKGEQEI